eukprot:361647-Chlamydomonas_euryale.AAC.5
MTWWDQGVAIWRDTVCPTVWISVPCGKVAVGRQADWTYVNRLGCEFVRPRALTLSKGWCVLPP